MLLLSSLFLHKSHNYVLSVMFAWNGRKFVKLPNHAYFSFGKVDESRAFAYQNVHVLITVKISSYSFFLQKGFGHVKEVLNNHEKKICKNWNGITQSFTMLLSFVS